MQTPYYVKKKKSLFEVKVYGSWLLHGSGSGSGAAFALVIRELCNDDDDGNENGKKAIG